MGRSRRVSIHTLLAEVLLSAALAFAPLALGSAPSWVLHVLAPLVLAAAAFAWVGATRQGEGIRPPLLALVPALGAAFCLLQLLPLPSGLLSLASAPAAELREFALLPLGLARARPISLDVAATWRELAKCLLYLCAFLTAAQLARSRTARRRLLSVVALTGALVVAIGLGHKLVGASSLFGLYAYAGEPPLLTTFGNPNHLAGYLTLTATVALGLGLSAQDRYRALLWGAAFLATGLGAFLSLSRGGIAFFVFAQLLLGLLYLKQRKPADDRPVRRPVLALSSATLAALLAVVAVAGYVAYDRILEELETADSLDKLQRSKVELYPSMLRLARHFPVAGAGRGAFEVAYPRFQELHPASTFTHAENLILQWVSELGVVPAFLLLALSALGVFRLLRREELGLAELAGLVGVLGVACHDLFDFALELPATALGASALLGIASRRTSDGENGGRARSRRLAAAGWAVAAALTAWALLPGRLTLRDVEQELAKATAANRPAEEVRALALGLLDSQPADYLLYEAVAQAYARTGAKGAKESLAFINRALFLKPNHPTAHRIAARALLRLGKRSQAWLEFRLAYEGRSGAALDEGLRHARGLEELRALVPPTPEDVLVLTVSLRARQRADEAEAVLGWALEELGPGASAAHRRAVSDLWLQRASLALDRNALDEAAAAIAASSRVEPDNPSAAAASAEVLARQGKRDEAIATLRQAVPRHPDNLDLVMALASHLQASGKPGHAREVLGKASAYIRTADQRVALLAAEGGTYEAETRYGMALQSYKAAARLRPEYSHLHYAVARMQERLTHYRDAKEAILEGIRASNAAPDSQAQWLSRLEDAEAAQQAARMQRTLEEPTSFDFAPGAELPGERKRN